MNTLLAPLEELEEFIQLKLAVEKGNTPVNVIGSIDAQKCHMIYGLSDFCDVRLIISYNEIRAKEIVEDYKMYDKNVLYYPAKDLIFYTADVHGQAVVKERMKVIDAIVKKEPVTIVTTMDAGMDYCVPIDNFIRDTITIKVGDEIKIEQLRAALVENGYEYRDQVSVEGEFSIRGGIVDVFALTMETPFRIEFFGDEVDTIRSIDVESQRSIENFESVEINPASELFITKDEELAGFHNIMEDMKAHFDNLIKDGKKEEASRIKSLVMEFKETYEAYHGMVNLESYINYFVDKPTSFFDYFKNRKTIVFIDEINRCIERAEAVEYEFLDAMKSRLEKGYILPKQMDILFSIPVMMKKLMEYPIVTMSMLDGSIKDIPIKKKCYFQVQAAPSYSSNFSMLVSDVEKYKKQKFRILLVSPSTTRAKRLVQNLLENDIPASFDTELDHEIQPGEVVVAKGNVRRGFVYQDISFIILTENDIFGAKAKKKKSNLKKCKSYDGSAIHSFNDLKIGDYVVHEKHGLGIYRGIEKKEIDNIVKDYIKISYAANGNLFIPATALESLQKYAGADAKPPKLNKLYSPEWKRTKAKVKEAVWEVAEELVELYAKRQARKGHPFEVDTVWQKEFEELFPYEETEDQMSAIEATKRDMESSRIMDRLICGDVGYGKTEIAIRAAFKAVMDGKQVALLVPTTILAGQHYNNFAQRMKDFGVNVELLCRLRTAAEQRKTIDGLKKGSVDIVIGTHKVLGKSVSFKNLGLLIVDEEQRFGVTHKEKLKQMKNEIDVLTLSATPIPRTLHMSLVGIRDMSVLTEPPLDRMPIQTFVMEKNEQVVREAIVREIGRGGQVYYVYNRVANIADVAASIAKLVPEATVSYAHGQMEERELEKTMFQFVEGDIDVLIATTIVESGLDIPNVNTILIDDADRLGLSQLYQLRGRVGRSNRTAYAFMLYKRNKILKEEAEKRLAAIKEFTELGSGFKISMKDLEIRGAGNLLGKRQHGHMAAVGYDMYCKMLNNAVKKLKGESIPEKEFDTVVDVKVDAYIPVSYIKNEFQKLDVYKRISEIESEEEKEDFLDELIDRFGEPPRSVINLLRIAILKAKAHKAYITEITNKANTLMLRVYSLAPVNPEGIPDLVGRMNGRLKFVPGKEPYFSFVVKSNILDDMDLIVDEISLLIGKEEDNDEKNS